jgi:hypothetical protein
LKKIIPAPLIRFFKLIALVVMLVGFQNCSSYSFLATPTAAVSESSGGGNGEPYDTKPDLGQYYRLVPEEKCADTYREPDKITVDSTGNSFSQLTKSCSKVSTVLQLQSIEFAPYNKTLLGYDGGIFARLDLSPKLYAKTYPLVEAWCRSDGAGAQGRDVVISLNHDAPDSPVTTVYEGAIKNNKIQATATSPIATKRSVSIGKVVYANSEYRVEVALDINKAGNTGKFAAHLIGQVNSSKVDQVMNCRMGGYFDLQRHYAPVPFRILGLTSNFDSRADSYLDSLAGALMNWTRLPEAAEFSLDINRADDGSSLCSLRGIAASSVSQSLATCPFQSGVSYKATMQDTTGYARIDNAANQPFAFDVAAMPCPANFVPVPQLAGYTSKDFCVAKFEMRNSGGNPVSDSAGLPWTNINRLDSISACQSLGAKYDLISIAEWQSIARNIEGVSRNWSLGAIGSVSGISRGHSNNTPALILAAPASDDLACDGTNELCDESTWSSQKRTHTLSNGEVIWDLAGNVREWQMDHLTSLFGPSNFISQITDSASFTNNPKTTFGPSGDYSNLNSDPFGGLGYAVIDAETGSSYRGGGYYDGVKSGIFAIDFSADGTMPSPEVGFRCVFHPN